MNAVYQYQYNHKEYSAPSPVYDRSIIGSSLIAHYMSTASLAIRKLRYALRYLHVSSRIPKRNFHESAQNNGVKQHSEKSRKPLSQNGGLKKVEKCMYIITASWATGHQIHSSVSCWLHFLIWMIWYHYLYTKNYKAVNTYHWIFCYPESGNTKQENLIVYGVNFTQWVCTGYCESWILSLPYILLLTLETTYFLHLLHMYCSLVVF